MASKTEGRSEANEQADGRDSSEEVDAYEEVPTEFDLDLARRNAVRRLAESDLQACEANFAQVTAAEKNAAQALILKFRRHADALENLDRKLQALWPDMRGLDAEVEQSLNYQVKITQAADVLEWNLRDLGTGCQQSVVAPYQLAHTSKTTPVKTPKLELTKFDGNSLNYQAFKDDFMSSIDRRSDLSIIDKFKLLKQSLEGEALEMTKGYFLTNEGYEAVKAALDDRFGDPQVAIFAHIEALLELPSASHEAQSLIQLRDRCEAHVRSLEGLGLSEDTYGLVFAPIILSKLPRFVKMELHRRNGSTRWTLKDLREHLKNEIAAREKSDHAFNPTSVSRTYVDPRRNRVSSGSTKDGRVMDHTAATLVVPGPSKRNQQSNRSTRKPGRGLSCIYCDGRHCSWLCEKYATVDSRQKQLGDRCLKCFSKDHKKANCRSTRVCLFCGKNDHHSSLCYEHERMKRKEKGMFVCGLNPEATPFVPANVNAVQCRQDTARRGRKGKAMLETALVRVTGRRGPTSARIVFDTGSTLSFVRKDLCQRIGARQEGSAAALIGRFGDSESKHTRFPVRQLQLHLADNTTMKLHLRELSTISTPIYMEPWDCNQLPQEISTNELAEPPVDMPGSAEIDILVGLDYYHDLVGPEQWRGMNGLVVKETAVGKIVTGFLCNEVSNGNQSQELVVGSSGDGSSGFFDLERFWRLEDIGIKDPPGLKDDEEAVERFKSTVALDDEGRYSVQWPFKTEHPDLPTNYAVAQRRLQSVCRKLAKDPALSSAYDKIFQDQLALGIIEKAPDKPEGLEHYLPHHAVVTPGKETTKVRVVFDASSKAAQHLSSLNDVIHRGPVFLNDLVGMLLRFRLPNVAIVSDVEKAFLQIALQPHHRDCTRFLWLIDPSKPPSPSNLIVYRYARVAFGVKASPFLLAGTIIHHAVTEATPTAIEIKDNTYMDNVLGGRENTEQAKTYYGEAKGLFSRIKMNLREWYSNDHDFIREIPEKDKGKSTCPSVLGLRWNTANDTIHCASPTMPADLEKATKREILKFVASAYDPCGWFSPITIRGKIIMQNLWKAKIGWDEFVDQTILKQWSVIQQDIAMIATVEMPRQVERCDCRVTGCELHAFCDASTQAYAAAIYLVTRNAEQATSALLFAKTRVAPVKSLTVPKLELMATILGVRMMKFVATELKLPIKMKCLWTDSTCVLGWLTNDKVNVVFVENRLKEIRNFPEILFGHVQTAENPADIPSRGDDLETLKNCQLWWKGPKWLRLSQDQWPKNPSAFTFKKRSFSPEHVSRIGAIPVENTMDLLIDPGRYSCLKKLLRVTAYVFRAVKRMRTQRPQGHELLIAEEVLKAKEFWEKRVQEQEFSAACRKSAEWKNKREQLGIYTATDGLLRCRGRYANAGLHRDAAHPKLLPSRHPYTRLVVINCHEAAMHTGLKGTLARLRQEYWIPNGRWAVKDIISKCQVCRTLFAGPFKTPDEAPLPAFRSQLKRPFAVVGTDYLGPMYVRLPGQQHKEKVWVVLFTCAAVRAIHLELVSAMSAQEFLLSFRRFMALYGTPEMVVSDNAKQFNAASRTFDTLWQEALEQDVVQDFVTNHGITWKFIPEKAPWFGGFYERLVALVKHALRASLGKWTMTHEELRTLLYEVAFVLNGRPLTYSENDPADPVLTPAHLLFRSRDMFPEVSGDSDPAENMRTADALIAHWKAGQTVLREFWDAWQTEYLLALRESWRPKRDRGVSTIPAEPGVVVLIKEPLPRGMWKVGRISKLRKSNDGKVRSVEVVLPGGTTIIRPVTLLYPIEGTCRGDDSTVTGEPAEEDSDEAHNSRPRRRAAVAAREGMRRGLR